MCSFNNWLGSFLVKFRNLFQMLQLPRHTVDSCKVHVYFCWQTFSCTIYPNSSTCWWIIVTVQTSIMCVCQEFGKDTFETLHNYNEPNALEIWVLKLHGFRLNCVVYICVVFLSALYCYGKFDWALFSNHLVQIVLLKVHRSVLFQLKCSFSCFCFFNFLRQNPTLQDWFLQEGT